MIINLTLYSTSHCHLCEEAKALLAACDVRFLLVIVDIAENETLLTQYGSRIPVLLRDDYLTELSWPFDENQIKAFLL